MADFQSQVNTQPAPATPGDWADANPRYFVQAGPGGFVAGAGGVTVARFAWQDTVNETVVNSFGFGQVTGFVHREQQALIVNYLASHSNNIPQGLGLSLCSGGGLWMLNEGTTEAEVGMKAYANYANGAVTFALTGSPAQGATSSSSTIAPESVTITGGIADTVLTVTATTGTIVAGTALSGTNVAPNTVVVAQLTGSPGSTGTYSVNVGEQTVAAGTTITGTYGLLTVGGTVTGTFGVGDVLSGSGVTAGSYITQLGSGTGQAGTYYITPSQTVGSPVAINATSNVETKWIVMKGGLPGEVVKVSDKPLG